MPNPPLPSPTSGNGYAWLRLIVSLVLMTIGSSGMYSISLVLPHLQADFGITRSQASLPYTITMIGFGLGGMAMGWIADRYTVLSALLLGALGLGLGFVLSGMATNIWWFTLAHGLFLGFFGAAANFAPLVADTSRWFTRHRGIALAICMSGNYFAGTIWPPVMQHFVDASGWRTMYQGVGIVFMLIALSLLPMYRRKPDPSRQAPADAKHPVRMARFQQEIQRSNPSKPLGLRPRTMQNLLCLSGIGCCIAMAMPQVHIIAYCGDLGFGATRGAQMLSLMLGMGIASRLLSGWVSDYIGGLRTLLLGGVLQAVALLLFLTSSDLVSLYVISALFGLFQGGIVPAYALIVREYFSPEQAGVRVGTVLTATLFGMAAGGWLSGLIYDIFGSYKPAFVHGILWNLVTLSVVSFLLHRARALRKAPAGQTG
ncbi:MAG: MFS transporter [Candidimonas sp.]